MLEKKDYTFMQVRSVFWLFHIGSQDERRPLDYTTRCFFSVSIFSSFFKNLNQSHPALYYTTRWFIFCLNFPQNIIWIKVTQHFITPPDGFFLSQFSQIIIWIQSYPALYYTTRCFFFCLNFPKLSSESKSKYFFIFQLHTLDNICSLHHLPHSLLCHPGQVRS